MPFPGIHVVRQDNGKLLVVWPSLPALRWCAGGRIYGPDVAVFLTFAHDNPTTDEYLELSRDERFYVVEDFI
jgi:hypothetical protein